MALIKSVRGFTPQVGKNCFLADNAVLIGDTIIGDECSIWFGTVLRGDVNSIRIGNRVNIQDGSVLHTLYEKSTIEIGDDVSIGHNVTIHGATIHSGALVGMGSVILDHAVVGEGAIVAAGSVVLSKTIASSNRANSGGAHPPNSSRWSTPSSQKKSTKRLPRITSCTRRGTKNNHRYSIPKHRRGCSVEQPLRAFKPSLPRLHKPRL